MNPLSTLQINLNRTRQSCLQNGSSMLLQRAARGSLRMVTLKQLLSGLSHAGVHGNVDQRIQNLATDSRRVVPGSLFFAMKGMRTKGTAFIEEAIQRGAVAVIAEEEVWTPPKIPVVLVGDVRKALAKISARFYQNPAQSIQMEAICGTNGKTVVSNLYRYLLGEERSDIGLLGTISYHLGKRTLPAYRTTPEPIELQAMLSQMRENQCEKAIIEVSSHGIHQGRVDGVSFARSAFLNLGSEHLDYHRSKEDYLNVIKSFYSKNQKTLKEIIVNGDDIASNEILGVLNSRTKVYRFGRSSQCDFRAENIQYNMNDTRFDLVWPDGSVRVVSPLVGSYNVENTLAAVAMAWLDGISIEKIVAKLFDFKGVRGRMEIVDTGQDFSVLIDYMHTEASYERGLSMLREITSGKLITVFGCGGDRDSNVRPRITRVVQEKSDFAVATSDNPRSEDITEIFSDMQKGQFDEKQNLIYVTDRKQAIVTALKLAKRGDTVLIAGKGHETFQEYEDCVVPFDDKSIAEEILKDLSH